MTGDAPSRVPQHAAIVLPTTGEFDSRTLRLAETLTSRGHRVTILARSGAGLPARDRLPDGADVIRVGSGALDGLPLPAGLRAVLGRLMPGASTRGGAIRRIVRVWLESRAQARGLAAVAPPADLYHAMAFLGLPVALRLARRPGDGAPVVYDARDLYADAANIARLPGLVRRLFAWNERRWARRVARVVTVNQPYADQLTARFGPPPPLVVMNCSRQPTPRSRRPRRLHERLGLPAEARVVLYHGGLSPDRGIEQLVDASAHLRAGVHVVVMGYGTLWDALVSRAADRSLEGRLAVLPAVPAAELPDWVASADVAAMPIQPTTLNHRLTTPNKLFEAMAAGVPIVASDLPGMAPIVRATGCGVLCDPTDPAAIAAAIGSILDAPEDQRQGYGRRGLQAVRERYNWEAQVGPLLVEYGRLTGRPW
jgi:glycosyltransferase involved in cell wall biosynthesis